MLSMVIVVFGALSHLYALCQVNAKM